MTDFQFRVISGKTVHELIYSQIATCQRVVEEAYLAHHRGQSVNPNSYFLRFPDKPSARIIALPAYLGDRFQVAGLKWIASVPDNITRGVPRASAVLILNDYETGYPMCCIESSVISAARTAASAVLAAERMSTRGRYARRIGFVGNGLIARYVYDFLLELGWSLDEVLLHDLRAEESARFASQVCRRERHRSVATAQSLDSLLKSCDLIVFATVAGTPHVHRAEVLAHDPLILHLSLRDLAPELMLHAQNIVDDVGHVLNAGTSIQLAREASGHTDFITGTLAQLISGEVALRSEGPRIFSPFGLGILDLAVGHWVYESALRGGAAPAVPDFYYDMKR